MIRVLQLVKKDCAKHWYMATFPAMTNSFQQSGFGIESEGKGFIRDFRVFLRERHRARVREVLWP